MIRKLYILLLLLLINSCVETPVPSESDGDILPREHGIIILNEGLQGRNNSTASRLDLQSGEIINDYFRKANDGLALGDVANDIALSVDTALVAVTNSHTIEAFNVKTGKWAGRIHAGEDSWPRHIALVNDSTAFFSDLMRHSVRKFNPRTMKLSNVEIPVGPAPEQIVFFREKLFVANSGYGDYLSGEPKAGTISVIDINSMNEIRVIECGPNTVELTVDPLERKLYAMYYHLPSKWPLDSLGGIVEYDIDTYEEISRRRAECTNLTLDIESRNIYFISGKHLARIDLKEPGSGPEIILENPDEFDQWYSIGIYNDLLMIGNSLNYQVAGEILIFDKNSLEQLNPPVPAGINPNEFIAW